MKNVRDVDAVTYITAEITKVRIICQLNLNLEVNDEIVIVFFRDICAPVTW